MSFARPAGAALVLSLFPGIGLLDLAFELEGFCVVKGPDLLWGGDVRRFHPPAGRFEGVIGGPPCKGESHMAHLNGTPGVSLRHEFARVVREASPDWWVMEAVQEHTDLGLEPCSVVIHSPRWLGELQSRRRYFHSNLRLERYVDMSPVERSEYKHAVLAGHGAAEGRTVRGMTSYTWAEMCELQGVPRDFDLPGFTRQAKREAMGNGVPVVMGRAIAKAVRRAVVAPDEPAAAERRRRLAREEKQRQRLRLRGLLPRTNVRGGDRTNVRGIASSDGVLTAPIGKGGGA
jgi:DNA (cytosine-5)-methyltransferase 1